MIMTDRDNNQITAFHPGAMMQAHANRIDGSVPDIRVGIIAPDGRDAMIEHAAQFQAAGIPFVFDPGQGLPMFSGEELTRFVEQATWVTVNDYEGKMLCERTGLGLAELSRKVQGLVVTLGGQGCEVWVDGVRTVVPPTPPAGIVDPTGCGDAWRGALLFGLERGWVSGFLTRREGPRSLGVERGLCSRGSRCLLCGGLFGGSCFLGRGRSLLGGSGCLLRRGRSLLRRSRSLLRRSRSLLGGSGCLLRRGRSLLGGCSGLLRRGRSLLGGCSGLLRRGRSLLGGCSGLLRRGRSLLGGCSGLLRRSSSLFSGSSYFFSRCCGLFGGRSLLRGGGLLGGRFFRSCHHFLLGSVGKEHSTPALGKDRFMEMGFVPSP